MPAVSPGRRTPVRRRDSTSPIELDRLHTTPPDPENESDIDDEGLVITPPQSSESFDSSNDKMRDRDTTIERRVRMKLDFILLPFLSLLFLFNSLDKSNIGSAETGHFTKDTGLPAEALNVSVAFFFAAFVTLQPVGAALGRKYGMARYVPTCMALWGLCTSAHIFITKEWQLVLLRTTVGILEAGFYPTTVSYLSLFYTRFEFAKRLGMFYGQAAVAGAMGGLLSWAVFRQFPDSPSPSGPPGPHVFEAAQSGGWKSWQVLFLIEGMATMVIALIGFVWLPHSADTAWFLSKEERICAEQRIRQDRLDASVHDSNDHKHMSYDGQGVERTSRDRRNSDDAEEISRLLPRPDLSQMRGRSTVSTHSVTNDKGLSKADILSALLDWKVWYLLVCNILSAIPATAFSVFLPMVVKGLAHKPNSAPGEKDMAPATANLLTVPPFLAGALILWTFTAWSDRRRERLVPILCGLVILLAGLTATVLLPQTAYTLRYFALIVLLAGSFVPSPLTVAWLTNNMLEPGKRAIVLGINGWGNLAGVLSAMLFSPRFRDSGYIVPFFITLACVGVSFVGFAGFRILILQINQQREETIKGWDYEQREREQKFGDVGGHRTSWIDRLYGEERKREGDERLTFLYGL
ncbi:major facilitator superfamily domain-containing protein [Elsinoe ampelina]|uniref:Major facilitator superfamily domain-containing protein n=1 Tax=Elsinoe ampelina TaxID=302913 RepID=A0A6A6G1N9_9PEZI|nr:major facilitator superfamily domain-containing protein [Elsinoe ampelina]